MRKLNSIDINPSKCEATLGGGITMVEALREAKKAKVHIGKSIKKAFSEISNMVAATDMNQYLGLATRWGVSRP
jgi:hypothetical protein